MKTLALSLLLLTAATAEEPVVRVQSISPVQSSAPTLLKQRHGGESQAFRVSENSTGYLKDHYLTDPNTVAALEFLIGGRVGINSDTEIEIVDQRSVASNTTGKRIVLNRGSLWVKADARSLKQPLEIQTNGGVMGIKGTEFTTEVLPDGRVRVCCFESNSQLGGVEIRDPQGQVVGLAKPGDDYTLDLRSAPIVQHREDIGRFRDETLQRSFEVMRSNPVFKQFFGELGEQLSFGVNTAYSAANQVSDLQNGPLAPVVNLQSQVQTKGASLQTVLDWSRSLKNPPAPVSNFPQRLSPDGAGPAYPNFQWASVAGCQGYVVMLGNDPEMQDLLFTERSGGESLKYPLDMRPLQPGTYYWRVIPVDAQNRPVEGLRGAQTSFSVR